MRTWVKRLAWLTAGLVAAGVLLVLASLVWLWVQRQKTVTLPAPGGPYPVGRMQFDWVDPAREEVLTAASGDRRELVVWLWYPAAPAAGAAPAAYLPPVWAAKRQQIWGPAQLLQQNPNTVRPHAVENAPLAVPASESSPPGSPPPGFLPPGFQPPYPLLVMAPGYGPLASDYTTLAEDLASRGYIVAGINPTYSAAVVAFPDGRLAYPTPQGSLPDNPASYAEFKILAGHLADIWAGDMRFVVDRLAQINAGEIDGPPGWAGHIDLAHVGFLGHSLGGAAAAEACRLDSRCQAGADLDGYLFGNVLQTGLQQPFLFLWSDSDSGDSFSQQAQQDIRSVYSRLPHGAYRFQIHGAQHFNFTDFAAQFSLLYRLTGNLGSIDGRRGLQITRQVLAAFFDRYLKNEPSPLLDGPSPAFPEVEFQKR